MVEKLKAVGDMPRPDIVERRRARRDCATRCHSASSPTKRSRSRCVAVRDGAESIERVGRRRAPHARVAAGGVGLAFDIAEQPRERRRRDAVDAPGLAEARRPHAESFWRTSVGKPADRRIVEVGGEGERLVPPHRVNVSLLALQIDGVLRVGADLLGDLRAGSRRAPARSRRAAPGRCPERPGARRPSGGCRPG